MGEEEIKLTKKNLGWPEDSSFLVPDEVKNLFSSVKSKGEEYEKEWNEKFKKYKSKYPEEAKLFESVMDGDFGTEWKDALPVFEVDGKKLATRAASGKVLDAITPRIPTMIGGFRRFDSFK